MPSVYEKVNGQMVVYDLGSRLMHDRIIQLTGEITKQTAERIVAQLLYLDSKGTEPITMYINSPGGSVPDGLAIIDTMELIESPVYTTAIGEAMSMGAVILACGQKGHRSATQNAEIMIHQLSGGSQGKMQDMETMYFRHKDTNRRLTRVLAQACGKEPGWLETYMREDRFMEAPQAVEFGLIDQIAQPKKKPEQLPVQKTAAR